MQISLAFLLLVPVSKRHVGLLLLAEKLQLVDLRAGHPKLHIARFGICAKWVTAEVVLECHWSS